MSGQPGRFATISSLPQQASSCPNQASGPTTSSLLGGGGVSSSRSSGRPSSSSTPSSGGGVAQARPDAVSVRQNDPGASAGPVIRECLRTTPIVTLTLVLTMIALWIWTAVRGGSPFVSAKFAACPSQLFYDGTIRYFFSSPFFHLSFFHVTFNMIATYFLGKQIERQMGSLSILGQVFVATFFSGLIYDFCLAFISKISSDKSYMYTCSAGFSGVLFYFILVAIRLYNVPTISFCGFPVPTFIYPWLMLLIMSLLSNGVSFWGHFSGLISGYLYLWGLLNLCSLPRHWLVCFERQTRLGLCLSSLPGYIQVSPEVPEPVQMSNLAFTRGKFTDLALGRCVESCMKSTCGTCCHCPCLGVSGVIGNAPAAQAYGGMPNSGGHVLGASSPRAASAAAPAAGGGGGGYRLGDDVDLESGRAAVRAAPGAPAASASGGRAIPPIAQRFPHLLAHSAAGAGAAAGAAGAAGAAKPAAAGRAAASRSESVEGDARMADVELGDTSGIAAAAAAPGGPGSGSAGGSGDDLTNVNSGSGNSLVPGKKKGKEGYEVLSEE